MIEKFKLFDVLENLSLATKRVYLDTEFWCQHLIFQCFLYWFYKSASLINFRGHDLIDISKNFDVSTSYQHFPQPHLTSNCDQHQEVLLPITIHLPHQPSGLGLAIYQHNNSPQAHFTHVE
jgi:hypothetical protein